MANASGCRRLPRGQGSDFLGLFREKGYALPFKVEGYFSVRFAEPMVTGDDRATVINRRPDVPPAPKKTDLIPAEETCSPSICKARTPW